MRHEQWIDPELLVGARWAQFMGEGYALGATAYEEDPVARQEIEEINAQLYCMIYGMKPIDCEICGKRYHVLHKVIRTICLREECEDEFQKRKTQENSLAQRA